MDNIELAETSKNPKVLDRLSKDPDWKVRRGVARNQHTPPKTLDRLSEDLDRNVRWKVAENPHTPPETLIKMLSEEKNKYIIDKILERLNKIDKFTKDQKSKIIDCIERRCK